LSAPGGLPRRPLLADHALARLHVVGGEELVVVHDTRTGRLYRLGPREWAMAASADGTRDLDGVLLAAARRGARATPPALRAFFEALAGAGLLVEDAVPSPADDLVGTPPERPLAVLSGFRLTCTGQGGCCRQYASIVFSPLEAARARALLPLVCDAGREPEGGFSPERGALGDRGSAVAMIDGRCAYLDEADRCALHAAGGARSKPLGCRLYPATFVDDGDEVRASVAVECACVLASADASEGEPLVDPRARSRGDLDEAAHVDVLAVELSITEAARAARGDAVAWSRRALARVEAEPGDLPALFWSLARDVEARGLEGPHASGPPPALAAAEARPWLEALAPAAAHRAREEASFRSPRDLARLGARWIADTSARLLEPEALAALLTAPAPRPDLERFYARAVLHGHALFTAGLPLTRALRDRAVRLLVARAATLVPPPDDAAFEHPLAVVEAILRGHGLGAYAHDSS
jgi:lysine-N-methylase